MPIFREEGREEEGPRVLVVDDDPDIRALLDWVLGRAGWTVYLAGSVTEALRIAAAEPVHLGVLDVRLGKRGDPRALVDALRSLPDRAELPLVFLTARVGPKDRDLYARLGIPFIPKPFDVSRLPEQLRLHLRP